MTTVDSQSTGPLPAVHGWILWGICFGCLLLATLLRGPADQSPGAAVFYFLILCPLVLVGAGLLTWLAIDVEILRLAALPIVPAGGTWFATTTEGLYEARMKFDPVWTIPLVFGGVWFVLIGLVKEMGLHPFFAWPLAGLLLPLVHLIADRPRVIAAINKHTAREPVTWRSAKEVVRQPRVIVALVLTWIPALLGTLLFGLLALFALSAASSDSTY